MKVYQDFSDLPSFSNTIITIGSFDGVHVGHQKIIKRLKYLSAEQGRENVVITFHPHPRSVVFPKDKSLRLLNDIEEKIDLFRSFGIDHLAIMPFSVEFSQISSEEYISNFLVRYFRPSMIVIGYDHRYGKNRAGDITLLQRMANKYSYQVEEISKQVISEITISSTQIRNALLRGDLSSANTLLHHPYPISGKVVRGKRVGRDIGYPTANVQLSDPLKLIPKDGIYACYIDIGDQRHRGMLYIGHIPTLNEEESPKTIEVNIFDFDEDIYDQRISLKVMHFLRDDQKFDNLESLKNQLAIDEQQSLEYFDGLSAYQKKATIAILNYNTADYLERFLPYVQRSSTQETDIMIIDNASTDDSVKYVREWYPEINLIEHQENYGFAQGYNLGLIYADTEYLILLNSDVEVTDDWLDPILSYMDAHPDVGIAMPKIRSLEDKSSYEYAGAAGGHIDYLYYPFCRGRIFDTVETDEGQYNQVENIFWASGAAFVIRKDLYEKLGGLDSDYFAHQEEIDLCWRAWNTGHRVVVIPESTVYHIGGGSLGYDNPRKVYLNFRNNLNTIIKNEKGSSLLWKLPLRYGLDTVAALKYILSGKFGAGINIWKAQFAVLFSIFSTLKKRKKIKASSAKAHPQLPIYQKSILLQYYLSGNKKYSDLP